MNDMGKCVTLLTKYKKGPSYIYRIAAQLAETEQEHNLTCCVTILWMYLSFTEKQHNIKFL